MAHGAPKNSWLSWWMEHDAFGGLDASFGALLLNLELLWGFAQLQGAGLPCRRRYKSEKSGLWVDHWHWTRGMIHKMQTLTNSNKLPCPLMVQVQLHPGVSPTFHM